MYDYADVKRIKPQGWLLQQLKIQANGLSGNLDKVWADVRDSAWIGGNREGWERVPYWLDGFIPLAFLLEDKDMITRAEKYINSILERQKADGWICPCEDEKRSSYDIWAHFLICKVLALYIEFTDNSAAFDGLYRAMKCLDNSLKDGTVTLFDWGKFRWYEALIPIQFLYEKTNEKWLMDLGQRIRNSGTNYFDYTETWKKPLNKWTFHTHIVNLCMMFKYEAVCVKLFGEKYENKAEELWSFLEKYNGTAFGGFTGDENLAGLANNHGTELCSVVELMYSCEILYSVTKNGIWADRLERLAFNALPATLSDDMWTHQYVQQVNQIACKKMPGKSYFTTNNSEAHIFGLEPHFGCCTANHNQGWPKFVLSAFMQNENGIHIPMMLPVSLETKIGNASVKISVDTEYPFNFCGEYTVTVDKPVNFELSVRIPEWATGFEVNGTKKENNGVYVISKEWKSNETFTVTLFGRPHLCDRPYALKSLNYGPLLFALPLKTDYTMYEYVKDGVERKFPYCDYELTSKDEWRYGFAEERFEILQKCGDDIPFSSKNPRILIKTKLRMVDWEFEEGYEDIAGRKPNSAAPIGDLEEKILVPYGCAKLRMTEMPLVEENL